MKVDWHDIAGVQLHVPKVHTDDRGSFVKHYDSAVLMVVAQQICSTFNRVRGTVRGMHLQAPPFEERKLLWCTAGEIWDVLVDMRHDASTYGAWTAVHLRAEAPELLEVPPGVAHGYQTLVDATSVTYVIDGRYDADAAWTLAWDDPTVGVDWPLDVTSISEGDRTGMAWPLFS